VDGVPEEVLVEALSEIEVYGGPSGVAAGSGKARETGGEKKSSSGKRPRPTRPGHVTTAMPGTIVEVLAQKGATVKAGDPVLVIEAMKMENEVQAPIGGTVVAVFVTKGDAVTPDEALIEIQPE
jgi:pyruvate carboxylase subunit B